MKKILVLVIFSYGQLVALDKESTLKIYEHVFSSMIPTKPLSVQVKDPEYIDVFKFSDTIVLSRVLKDAKIGLITNKKTLHSMLSSNTLNRHKTILFATDYHYLKKSEDIVGAFYWKKGRSQLLFIRSRLKRYGIVLPSEYQEYIVDEL